MSDENAPSAEEIKEIEANRTDTPEPKLEPEIVPIPDKIPDKKPVKKSPKKQKEEPQDYTLPLLAAAGACIAYYLFRTSS